MARGQRSAPENENPGSLSPSEQLEPTPTETVRVWSLTGAGFVDEQLGVRFDGHYADVDPAMADKLVARRGEHIAGKDENGEDRIEPVELYSRTKPAHLESVEG